MEEDTRRILNNPEDVKVHSKVFNQYFAGIASCLAWLAAGFSIGYTSPALPSMEEEGILAKDDLLKSWIGSLMPMGGFVGGLVAGTIVFRFGRKLVLLVVCSSLFCIGFITIGATQLVALILIGRFICGLACGITSCVVPPYIAEIAQPDVRGKISTFVQFCVTTGIMVIYIAGSLLSWSHLAFFCLLAPVLLTVAMVFSRESPTWLLSRGKEDQALKALKWFRGEQYDSAAELEETRLYLEKANLEKGTFKDLFTTWTVRPLMVSVSLMFFQQVGGINAVMFYTVDIFHMSKSSINDNIATIIIGVIQVVMTGVSILLIDRLGRRILLFVSSALQGLSLVMLSGYFFFKPSEDPGALGIIPLISLMLYIIGFSVGFGPIPWVIMGELFPSSVKNKASAISSSFNWLMAFVVSYIFGPLLTLLGAGGIFLSFAIMNLLAFIFCFFYVPETKNKKLEEIENKFRPEKRTTTLELAEGA